MGSEKREEIELQKDAAVEWDSWWAIKGTVGKPLTNALALFRKGETFLGWPEM